jgi:hypothetical protein
MHWTPEITLERWTSYKGNGTNRKVSKLTLIMMMMVMMI